MLLNPSSCTNQSSTGAAAGHSNSNSHHPTKQWREALQPMMKSSLTNNAASTQKERGISETSQRTYTMGANQSLAQNMTISLAPHNDSKHASNLRLSGQFTTSLAHNEKSQTNLLQMAKSSPITSSTHSKYRTPYMNSTTHKYGYSGTRRGGRSQNNPNQSSLTASSVKQQYHPSQTKQGSRGATGSNLGGGGISSSMTSSALNSYSAVKQNQNQQHRALSSSGLRHAQVPSA